jgi:hypothetical protein
VQERAKLHSGTIHAENDSFRHLSSAVGPAALAAAPAGARPRTNTPQVRPKSTGIYNLTRALGGAIALAAIGTALNNRQRFHRNQLIEDISPACPARPGLTRALMFGPLILASSGRSVQQAT